MLANVPATIYIAYIATKYDLRNSAFTTTLSIFTLQEAMRTTFM